MEISFSVENGSLEQLGSLGVYLPPGSTIRAPVSIEPPVELPGGINCIRQLSIGAFSYSWSRLAPSVQSVGRYCSIGGDVFFGELEHPTNCLSTSSFVYEPGWMWQKHAERNGVVHSPALNCEDELCLPISIGNDVWIGVGAYIKSGVILGDGCIVGARTVVTRNVPPYAVVVGNPGRVVRYRFPDKVIEELVSLKWWDYAFTDFRNLRLDVIDDTVARIRELVCQGSIHPYLPEKIRIVPTNY